MACCLGSLKEIRWIYLMLLFVFSSAPAFAGSDDVVVENAWSRASIGTKRPGVAYMTITNSGDEPMTLTGLESKVSGMPQIHRTSTDANGATSY